MAIVIAGIALLTIGTSLVGCNQGHNGNTTSASASESSRIHTMGEFTEYIVGIWCMPGAVQGLGTDLTKVNITSDAKRGIRYWVQYRIGQYSNGWSDEGMKGKVEIGTNRDADTGEFFYYASLQDTAYLLVKRMPAFKDGSVEFYSGDNPILVGHQDCGQYE